MPEFKCILLVDNDPYDVELVRTGLAECNVVNEVVVARDAEEALDFLKASGKFAGRRGINPAVVMLDLKLPKMGATEVLKYMKADEKLKPVPVVILASSHDDPDIAEGFKQGANTYVVKPFDFHNFIDAVKQTGASWAIINGPPAPSVMDIYSLGIMFYELLTNKKLFSGNNGNDPLERHLYAPLPDISIIRNNLPILLSEMISGMTDKNPSNRHQSAEKVISALKEISNIHWAGQDSKSSPTKTHNQSKEPETVRLKARKETELPASSGELSNYSITSLFHRFKAAAENLNRSLQRSKILIIENKALMAEKLELTFIQKKIRISFFSLKSIQTFVEENIGLLEERFDTGQEAQTPLFIREDGVILVGKAVVHENSVNEFGFNLLLRQNSPADPDGEWWLCWFEDSELIQNSSRFNHYPLDENQFYREFEIGREDIMHMKRMHYKKLEDADITSLLERVFD